MKKNRRFSWLARPFEGIDRTFLFLVLGIMVFGFLMLASASGPVGFDRFGDSYYFVKHQFTQGVVPGLVVFFAATAISASRWRKYASILLFVSLALLVLVFIPGIGADFGTFAKSWVLIGGFSFQPAEIVKLTFLIYLADWLVKQKDHLKDYKAGLLPFLVVLGTISGLILLQPDLGTLSIIVAMAFIVYFVAGGNLVHLTALAVGGSMAFFIAIQSSAYRLARFTTFLHPELDPEGVGYQVNQALLAVGSGGLFGRGYGHSLQKFQYLPEVIGDSIFAVLAEEFGLIVTVVLKRALKGDTNSCSDRCHQLISNSRNNI
jgi:cell division protein FtsW